MRHASHLYQSATRLIELGFYSLQAPRERRAERARASSVRSKRLRRRGLLSPRPLLIHYHLFKNAGSSFEWSLQQAFGAHFHTYDTPTSSGIISARDLRRYVKSVPEVKAVSSHQAVLPPPNIRGREVIASILIRDPIARLRSIYAFERRQTHLTPGSIRAKELDFKGYVEWRLSYSPAMICNYQVFFCSRRIDTPEGRDLAEADLQRAVHTIDLVDLVGTVERYQEWLTLAQSVLGLFYPDISLTFAHHNARETGAETTADAIFDHLRTDLGVALADYLLECNQLDMRLHQVADAILTRRLAEQAVKVRQRDAYVMAKKRLEAMEASSSSDE